jgi:hypothetical protein
MNSQFRKNGLMTALSAGVFAVSSFAAVNAYASDGACVVCWSDPDYLCESIDIHSSSVDSISKDPALVMWMSCYERRFDVGSCQEAKGTYFLAGYGLADNTWWRHGYTCQGLRDEGYIADSVPLAAGSLTYTPICLVKNEGSDYEDVDGVGNLAPGATGLLNEACPK